MVGRISKRHEKSLGLLTKRFYSLLRKAKNGVLNLKKATKLLAVREKRERRIYDITSVLQGIGLIEKKGKNRIKWRGARPGQNASVLKKQVERLEEHKRDLDKKIHYITQSTKNVLSDFGNERLSYVNEEDVKDCFKDDQLIVLEAPLGTELSVGNLNSEDPAQSLYLHVKSSEPFGAILIGGKEQEKETEPSQEVEVDGEVEKITASGSNHPLNQKYLLRLSPPITKDDFYFSLQGSEGLCELFDMTL